MAKMTLDELVSQLRAAFGIELRAVVLYGSAASGEHVAKRSDYNVLVLVDSLSADRLSAAGAASRAWSGAGNPPPLTLTTQEWHSSSDIFPMEYADVLERHRVLYGTLPTDVRVDAEHLRLELEHEAMGTLLQLRRGALAAGGDGRAQLELLEDSASTIMVILRSVLRLKGETPPGTAAGIVERVAAASGIDASPFLAVVRHRRGEGKLKPAQAGPLLAGTLAAMQGLVGYLNQFRPRG